MEIKQGDIFDLYEDGMPTRRCIAHNDSKDGKVLYAVLYNHEDHGIEVYPQITEIDGNIESIICNIKDIENNKEAED